MAACTSRFLTISGVALALALAAPAARAQEVGATGVDFTAMDGSVLNQDWMLGEGPGLVVPQAFGGGLQFPNETSAATWNFLMVLLAFSDDFDPENPYAFHDPSDPATAQSEGKCSFVQPQYCSAIQAFFDVRPSEPEFVTTLAAIRGGDRRGGPAATSARRIPGRPETPDPSALSETTRTVNPQLRQVPIPEGRVPVLPDGEDPVALPDTRDWNAFRAGGSSSFGRFEFVWHHETPQGCLPPRRGLSALSGRHAGTSATALARAQRRGRCPPR